MVFYIRSMKPPKRHYDHAARAEHHVRALAELREGAAQLAEAACRKAEREAKTWAEGRPVSPALPAGRDPAEAFVRLCRTVRAAIALEAEIAATSRLLERRRGDLRRGERLPPPTNVLPRIVH